MQSLDIVLRTGGINNILSCRDSREVIPLLSKEKIGLMLLDLSMPYISGEELLSMVVSDFPDISIIIITGVDEVDMAVKCMKTGVFDYIVKPVDKDRLITSVKHAIRFQELEYENRLLSQHVISGELEYPEAFSEIITNNAKMLSIFQYIESIARTSQSLLITGETGVGKELIARATHILSRCKGPFVAVNVAGLDDNIFSDTLFGHKKGAFTGATESRSGLVEHASKGTLFLDEIGEISHASQIKLLRLLQEHEYHPIGSDLVKKSDARVIAATNQNIQLLQNSERFRKDLYYRLNSHHIHIPPLRERLDDLPIIFDHIFEKASKMLGKRKPTYPPELLTLLGTYHFPGNIRELESMIFDSLSRHKSGRLSMELFELRIRQEQGSFGAITGNDVKKEGEAERLISFPERLPTLKHASQQLIAEAMKRSKGNQNIAAQLLGITRQALNKRLRTEEIRRQERDSN